LCFDPFPNYHIRSNAFMLTRANILRIWPGFFPTKRVAYLFENGKRSMTRRILRMQLQALVVGKDGVTYQPQQWPLSHTFRHGLQENLLVADNQTRQFLQADIAQRKYLSSLAWGEQADPGQANPRQPIPTTEPTNPAP
jgi:hypothetical protein